MQMDYYSCTNPEGWQAKLALLADPQRRVYPESGQLSTVDRENACRPETDVLTTELRGQYHTAVCLHK